MLIYSNERRLEVLKAYAAGLTTREIALQFQCSESWVRQVKPEFRDQEKTAETPSSVVQRRLLCPITSPASGSCLELRFCALPDSRWPGLPDVDRA